MVSWQMAQWPCWCCVRYYDFEYDDYAQNDADQRANNITPMQPTARIAAAHPALTLTSSRSIVVSSARKWGAFVTERGRKRISSHPRDNMRLTFLTAAVALMCAAQTTPTTPGFTQFLSSSSPPPTTSASTTTAFAFSTSSSATQQLSRDYVLTAESYTGYNNSLAFSTALDASWRLAKFTSSHATAAAMITVCSSSCSSNAACLGFYIEIDGATSTLCYVLSNLGSLVPFSLNSLSYTRVSSIALFLISHTY